MLRRSRKRMLAVPAWWHAIGWPEGSNHYPDPGPAQHWVIERAREGSRVDE